MTTSAERFMRKVSPEPNTGCWLCAFRDEVRVVVLRSTLPLLRDVAEDIEKLGHPGLARDVREHREALYRLANRARVVALPVPPATTAVPQPERARLYDAEAWDGAMDALGKMRERAERAEALARNVGTLNAAPEAKPAESEAGWICVRRQRVGGLIANGVGVGECIEVYAARADAEEWQKTMTMPKDWDVVSVRLALAPAPEEPEETHR